MKKYSSHLLAFLLVAAGLLLIGCGYSVEIQRNTPPAPTSTQTPVPTITPTPAPHRIKPDQVTFEYNLFKAESGLFKIGGSGFIMVTVKNQSPYDIKNLTIGIRESFFNGFVLTGAEPKCTYTAPTIAFLKEIANREFYLSEPIGKGEEKAFTFTITAANAGEWAAYVNLHVWTDDGTETEIPGQGPFRHRVLPATK